MWIQVEGGISLREENITGQRATNGQSATNGQRATNGNYGISYSKIKRFLGAD